MNIAPNRFRKNLEARNCDVVRVVTFDTVARLIGAVFTRRHRLARYIS